MKTYGLTGRLARFSASNPWKIVGVWIGLFVIAGMLIAMFPASMTPDANFTNNPDSVRADELLEDHMPANGSPDEMVIVKSDAYSVDDPEFEAFVGDLMADISAVPGDFVGEVASYYQTGDENMLSDDRSAMIVPVFVGDEEASAASYVETIKEVNGRDGFTVATGGEESVTVAFEETSESDLITGETIGISVALLVLVVVFGTLVSAGIPLLLAIVSITIAIGMTMVIGNIWELSIFVTNMIVMIGLAVGIDYTLFIVGRYREERAKGVESYEAIIRAGDTATKAVLFSGITVVIALFGMLLVPSTIFVSLGTGAILVVLAAVAGTLTLLPAALALLSGKVSRGTGRTLTGVIAVALFAFAALFQFGLGVHPAFPIIYVVLGIGMLIATALNVDPFHSRSTTGENGFWDRITRFVMAHPVALVSATTVSLIAVGLVYFTIETGQSGITTLPEDTTARQAFTILSEDFSGVSLEEPNTVVVQADDVNSTEVQSAVDSLTANVADDGNFGPARVQVNENGDLLAVSFPSTSDVQSSTSLEAVERLREEYVPQAFGGLNVEALVTGPTAFTLDFNSVVEDYTPIVFVFVLGMSFFLLLLAFRSIIVPIKSIIMNLLSVGASYGLLVAIFQHGIGNELFGFQQVDRIDAWIPLMMFTILFGLSMDYHVFLLSRIKEHYDATGQNTEAVAYGLRTTASIITGAALIMVAVFGGFAMGELSMFQQMGFGLAVAVILDATIIRTVLVPAGMKLLREYNWYFPNWLNWLPKINVEGIPQAETEQPVVEGIAAD